MWKNAIVLVIANVIAGNAASAAVVDSNASGFSIEQQIHIATPPDKVYAALVQPQKWWDPRHTYSHDAANLSLDPKAGGCWCERLSDGGTVQHLVVVFADPGKMLRVRGALGPLQATGGDGAFTWTLKSDGQATDLTLAVQFGGYMKGGFTDLSGAVDQVLGDQNARLKSFVETGQPNSVH